jgi:hypothetical protein
MNLDLHKKKKVNQAWCRGGGEKINEKLYGKKEGNGRGAGREARSN